MNTTTKVGLTGTVLAALCCFTPVLVWLLVGLGFGGLVAYLDPVLLPLLGLFIALTIFGYMRGTAPRD